MTLRRVLLLLALPSVAACSREIEDAAPPPVAVHCTAPRPEDVDETIALRGRIEPPPGGDLPVASQVAGRVVSVAIHEGQRVASGELLATVDGAASRDALRQADAAVTQARTAEINARATLARTEALVARGIAAKQELDDARAREDAAVAAIGGANAASDLARRTLGRVVVRSDSAGVVTRLWRGPGALVDGTSATPILQLAAEGVTHFVAEATERELSRIEEGQTAEVTLVSSNEALAGTVLARATALDPQTGLGSVRLLVKTPKLSVPFGSFGRAQVTVAHRTGVLVVTAAAPRGAIADGAEVALCVAGHAELRAIEVGWRDEQRIEILRGLTAADEVAVDHVLGLEDGTLIRELP
jgi:RND family efflux transporter MFP subunit